jgi:hypothetical protein
MVPFGGGVLVRVFLIQVPPTIENDLPFLRSLLDFDLCVKALSFCLSVSLTESLLQ